MQLGFPTSSARSPLRRRPPQPTRASCPPHRAARAPDTPPPPRPSIPPPSPRPSPLLYLSTTSPTPPNVAAWASASSPSPWTRTTIPRTPLPHGPPLPRTGMSEKPCLGCNGLRRI
ncbi:hypothetical protein B0H13DRAFT_1723665, partial [Mycena leptocephala]